jgi:aldehyde dehydrogenase (NAD+)
VTFGRYINCGQTCVAPDYVLVHSKVKTQFVSAMVEKIKQFYGEEPVKSDDLGRIVN